MLSGFFAHKAFGHRPPPALILPNRGLLVLQFLRGPPLSVVKQVRARAADPPPSPYLAKAGGRFGLLPFFCFYARPFFFGSVLFSS